MLSWVAKYPLSVPSMPAHGCRLPATLRRVIPTQKFLADLTQVFTVTCRYSTGGVEGTRKAVVQGSGSATSRTWHAEVLLWQREPSATLMLLGLVTPPRGERPQAHRRSGRPVPRRVAALVRPLQDTCDDTTGHRHRPDRSGSVADSGHIFARGRHGCVASHTPEGRVMSLWQALLTRPCHHEEIVPG